MLNTPIITKLFFVAILSGFITLYIVADETSHATKQQEINKLEKFAYANCLYGYFKKHKYDSKDILNIAGSFVETGTSSFEVYQDIADYIDNFQTSKKTKQNIDPDLLKCFYLDEDQELKNIISKAVN